MWFKTTTGPCLSHRKRNHHRQLPQRTSHLTYCNLLYACYFMIPVDCIRVFVYIFSARQHICYSALYAIARPSLRLSVTRMDQSKTVEVRIMQLSPRSSPMTLVISCTLYAIAYCYLFMKERNIRCFAICLSVVSSGDEHWTKVLQANDALGKLPVCPYHGKKLPLRHAFNDDAKTTLAGKDQVPQQPGDGTSCRRGRSSCAGTEDHPAGSASVSTETKERAGLMTLFDRFCQWLSDARRQSSLLRLPLPKSRSRRAASLRRSPDDVVSSSRGRRTSRRRRCNSASPSSSHGDLNDPMMHRDGSGSRTTSTCSSVTTATSTSTACSDAAAETTGNNVDVITGTYRVQSWLSM